MKLFLSIALFQAKGQAEYFGVNLIFEVVPEKFGIEKKFSYFGRKSLFTTTPITANRNLLRTAAVNLLS